MPLRLLAAQPLHLHGYRGLDAQPPGLRGGRLNVDVYMQIYIYIHIHIHIRCSVVGCMVKVDMDRYLALSQGGESTAGFGS